MRFERLSKEEAAEKGAELFEQLTTQGVELQTPDEPKENAKPEKPQQPAA